MCREMFLTSIPCLSADVIRNIRDPEKPETLEELDVVYEHGVKVINLNENSSIISIEFTPTVPHCSLATLIGTFILVHLFSHLFID